MVLRSFVSRIMTARKLKRIKITILTALALSLIISAVILTPVIYWSFKNGNVPSGASGVNSVSGNVSTVSSDTASEDINDSDVNVSSVMDSSENESSGTFSDNEAKESHADSENSAASSTQSQNSSTYTESQSGSTSSVYVKNNTTAHENTQPEKTEASKPLQAPKFKLLSKNDGKITATWQADKDADGYKVYMSSSKNGKYYLKLTTSQTSYTSEFLTDGAVYWVKVTSYKYVEGKMVESDYFSKSITVNYYDTYKENGMISETVTQVSNNLFNEINKQRVSNGLPRYIFDSQLSYVAKDRAQELISKFSHTRPNGTNYTTALDEYANLEYSSSAETVIKGPATVQELMDYISNNALDSEYMLSDGYTSLGIGVCYSAGVHYWTLIYKG